MAMAADDPQVATESEPQAASAPGSELEVPNLRFGEVTRRAREPLGVFATRVVRDAIVNGELKPGERIYQETVADELGLSRIPVRDALRQLESEGLVRLTPNSPARVAEFDAAEFEEVYAMRERLEPLAVERSVPKLTDDQLQEVKALQDSLEAEWDDHEQVLRLDREFHLAIMQAAPMPRLLRLITDFWNSSQHYRRAYLQLANERDSAIVQAEHFLLLQATLDRDAKQAARIARNHIRRTRVRLVSGLASSDNI
jgi:DNA-binding GntR family transcriptional regulator